MPIYNLIKNGVIDNTIISDEIESIKDKYDSIEAVIDTEIIKTPIGFSISSQDIRSKLTIAEKVKWDNNSSHSIVTSKIEFTNPLPYEEAKVILQFLVDSGDFSQESVDKILTLPDVLETT